MVDITCHLESKIEALFQTSKFSSCISVLFNNNSSNRKNETHTHVTRTIKRGLLKCTDQGKYIYELFFHAAAALVIGIQVNEHEHSFQWSWNRLANTGKSSIFAHTLTQNHQNCILISSSSIYCTIFFFAFAYSSSKFFLLSHINSVETLAITTP